MSRSILVSRNSYLLVGYAWALVSLFMGGTAFSDYGTAISESLIKANPSLFAHYRFSAIFTVVIAVFILMAMGPYFFREIKYISMRRAFLQLIFLFMFVIACGCAGTLVLGVCKEFSDSLKGSYPDLSDISADMSGVIEPSRISLQIGLPGLLFLLVFGSPARHVFLRMFSSKRRARTYRQRD